MSQTKTNLLVVAHPDDESLFFAGLLMRKRNRPWKVICATDGNADGNGKRRQRDFIEACRLLKVHRSEIWGLSDRFEERLPVDSIIQRLRDEPVGDVFTHGPLGEYGHPHHQDVCLAVHRAFPAKKVYCLAYNCEPDVVIRLRPKEYAIKRKILGEIYRSETQRFLNFVPATWAEGFCQLSPREVEAVYAYFTQKRLPTRSELKKLRWMLPYFKLHKEKPTGARPF